MGKDDMPQLATCVYRRSGTANLEFKIRPPKDLQHLYPDKEWAHRCTLGTPDIREANRKGAALYAEWLAKFDRQRKGSTSVDVLTSDHGRLLAHYALRHILKDEATRVSAQGRKDRKDWLRYLEHLGPAALLEFADDAGLQFTRRTPGAVEAHAHFIESVKAQLLAELAELPAAPAPAPKAPKKPTSLQAVLSDWKTTETRTKDTLQAVARSLARMEEWQEGSTADVTAITRPMGVEFKGWLISPERGISTKTARDLFNWIKTLLKFAFQDLQLIPSQPWQGLEVKTRTKRRGIWEEDDLERLFSAPLFTSYALPEKQWKAGKDAAYWLPVLALYTGCRLGELCQLTTSDVLQHKGAWVLSVNEDSDEGAGKRVKTTASIRDVPIHSELQRLGFLDYVQAVQARGSGSLWPDLRLNDDKPSSYFSAWFGDFKKTIPGDALPTFHEFRHTVRTMMGEANIDAVARDLITGHEGKGSIGDRVYDHPTMKRLVGAVEAIRYGVTLPRVYVGPK